MHAQDVYACECEYNLVEKKAKKVGKLLGGLLSPLKIGDKSKASDGYQQEETIDPPAYLDPAPQPDTKPKPGMPCLYVNLQYPH